MAFANAIGLQRTAQCQQGCIPGSRRYLASDTLCKLAVRPTTADMIPKFVKDAYRAAMFGRPGPAFVDLPADLILGMFEVEKQKLTPLPEPPQPCAPVNKIRDVVKVFKNAKAPLVVIGKGAAYARAERQITALIDK